MFKTAIFVDGRFFLTKLSNIISAEDSPLEDMNSDKVAEIIFNYCLYHTNDPIKDSNNKPKGANNKAISGYLYRIFFYDCAPLEGTAHNPITNKQFKLDTTKTYQFTVQLHKSLKKKRKTALRLGRLDNSGWIILPEITKKLLNGKMKIEDLKESHIKMDIRQKEIDVKIGVDISSVSFKKQADKIVLISGDSDFVPAAKLARREGIDFILDSMGQQVSEGLFEHIDGLQTYTQRLRPPKANAAIITDK